MGFTKISIHQSILCFVFLPVLFAQPLYSQNKKLSAGIGLGYIPSSESSVYLGRDINQWVDREPSTIFEVNVTYRISDFFKTSVYFENEKANLKLESAQEESLNRWAAGGQWICNYPNRPLQWQLGGYTGFGKASYSVNNVVFSGLDYGIITGPAYERGNIGAALHLHTGFATYSGSDLPEEFSMHDIRLFLKLYYIF